LTANVFAKSPAGRVTTHKAKGKRENAKQQGEELTQLAKYQ